MVGKTVAVWAGYARILIGNSVSAGAKVASAAAGGITSVATLVSAVNQVISQAQNGVAKDYGGAKRKVFALAQNRCAWRSVFFRRWPVVFERWPVGGRANFWSPFPPV
ncbi:MAG: hypothetical protein RL092_590 [Bacteroidota bacterium]